MSPLGDRRRHARLDVVGVLMATLGESGAEARVLNISRNGALVVSPVAPHVGVPQPIHLSFEKHEIDVRAVVRHVSPIEGPQAQPIRYRVGLHFLDSPTALLHALA